LQKTCNEVLETAGLCSDIV